LLLVVVVVVFLVFFCFVCLLFICLQFMLFVKNQCIATAKHSFPLFFIALHFHLCVDCFPSLTP
jgi:hypothetical protein